MWDFDSIQSFLRLIPLHFIHPTETNRRSTLSHSQTPYHEFQSHPVYTSHFSFTFTSSHSTHASLHTSHHSHSQSHVGEVATCLLHPSSYQYTSSQTHMVPPTKDHTQTLPSHMNELHELAPTTDSTTQIHSSSTSHHSSLLVEELPTSPQTVSHPLLFHTNSSSPSILPSHQIHSPNTNSHSTHSSSRCLHSLHQIQFDSITTILHPTLLLNPNPHSIHSHSFPTENESLRDPIYTSQTHFLLSLPTNSTSSYPLSTLLHSISNGSDSHQPSFHIHSQSTIHQQPTQYSHQSTDNAYIQLNRTNTPSTLSTTNPISHTLQ